MTRDEMINSLSGYGCWEDAINLFTVDRVHGSINGWSRFFLEYSEEIILLKNRCRMGEPLSVIRSDDIEYIKESSDVDEIKKRLSSDDDDFEMMTQLEDDRENSDKVKHLSRKADVMIQFKDDIKDQADLEAFAEEVIQAQDEIASGMYAKYVKRIDRE